MLRSHLLAVFALSWLFLPVAFADDTNVSPPKATQQVSGNHGDTAKETSLPDLVARLKPSIATIRTYKSEQDTEPSGQGTAWFLAKNQIVTNHHVIEGATKADIRLASGLVVPVRGVVAHDEDRDIVILAVNVKDAPPALPLSQRTPREGARVFVIGLPRGLELTVSQGIVSSVRDLPTQGTVIQTTAAISPGSSGSPLFDETGHVVGVITSHIIDGQLLNFSVSIKHVAELSIGSIVGLVDFSKPAAKDTQDPELDVGLKILASKGPEEALPHFERAAKNRSDDEYAWYLVGHCLNRLARYREALEALNTALGIRPNESSYSEMGDALVGLGRNEEAVEAYKQAFRIEPDLAFCRIGMGSALVSLGRSEEAIEAYKQAIRIEPDNALCRMGMGSALVSLGRSEEAVEAYKQAIRIAPDTAEHHFVLGLSLSMSHRREEAVKSLRRAIQIAPEYFEAHIFLGSALAEVGRDLESFQSYKRAVQLQPDRAHSWSLLGMALIRLGRANEAIAAFGQAIHIDPEFGKAHLGLGQAMSHLDQFENAIEHYKHAIRIDPNMAKAHVGLGAVLLNLHRFEEAIQSFQQAIRLVPDAAAIHSSLGLCYVYTGQRSLAFDEYKILKDLDAEMAARLFDRIYP